MRAVVIVSALSLVLAASAARASDKIFDHQVAAQPRGVVEVSNVSGSIKVTGWDRPQVSVHAETGEGVERVDVTSENGRTLVKVVLPGHSSRDAEADLVVQIPKDSELDVSAVSADVTTTGVTGMQRLSAVSGDVTAEIAAADVEAKTVSGELRLKGHDQPARLHLSSVSGDLRLEHGAGDLEAGTVSGTMVVSLDSARSVRAHSYLRRPAFRGQAHAWGNLRGLLGERGSQRARQCRRRLCLRGFQLQRRHQRLLRRQGRAQRRVRTGPQAAGLTRGGRRPYAPQDHER